jgi:uncharacterized damage-inducible protein DinB
MNAAQYFDHWNVVWRDLLRGVAVITEEHLSFQPAERYPRNVGAILNHIADLEDEWIHFVIRRAHPAWPAPGFTPPTTLEGIRARLTSVHKATVEYLTSVPESDFNRIVQVPGDGTPKLAWILWHVLEQQIHHRGELFLCLSLLGLRRPEMDRPS